MKPFMQELDIIQQIITGIRLILVGHVVEIIKLQRIRHVVILHVRAEKHMHVPSVQKDLSQNLQENAPIVAFLQLIQK